ncbi:DnaJ C-terminal domain-containing protein [Oerskovia sp. M15]
MTVHVTPHPVFSVDDKHNLRLTVPVTFAEAALGATIEVPTLDGASVKVKVPAGTPSGRTLRVKGKGVTTAKATGDLLVTIQVVVPQKLSKAAKEAIEQLAAATDGNDGADVRSDLFGRAAETTAPTGRRRVGARRRRARGGGAWSGMRQAERRPRCSPTRTTTPPSSPSRRRPCSRGCTRRRCASTTAWGS